MIIDFFTSDLHFGHAGVIKYCRRPFETVEEMNEKLIENYNSVVSKNSTVLWVGDCFFCSQDKAIEIMDRLNGNKMLVMGNHDRSKTWMLKTGFEIVVERELTLYIGERLVRVNHFPYAGSSKRDGNIDDRFLDRRPPKVKGEVLIHGHTHSDVKRQGSMVHVGVDAWDLHPVHCHEVHDIIEKI